MTDRDAREARYGEWLATQGLRFGFAAEVAALAKRTRGAVVNDTPPVERWHRIVPTVHLVEKVREQFGATTLHSAYRSPEYNKAVSGAGDSQHSHNTAVDFACATGTPRAWHAILRSLRDAGAFTGGLGLYQTFVHVDTRGSNADWTG